MLPERSLELRPAISAIVCTFERGKLLDGALKSLARQSISDELYEVIVIDNGWSDNGLKIVKLFKKEYPKYNIISVKEPKRGLGYARNAGIRYGKGKYIAYMDDDARADADWLKRGLEAFEEVEPTPMCVGGRIVPLWGSERPHWFKEEYEERTWGPVPRFLSKGESFSGSNMIWRKDVLEAFGGFDVRVGVKGSYLSTGEETRLFEKIWDSVERPVFYYCPELVVYHMVPAWKMRVSYRFKRAFSWGQSWYLVNGPRLEMGRLILLWRIVHSIARKASLAVRNIRQYPYYQNWLVERISPLIGELGRLMACLGFVIPVKQR